MLAMLDVTLPTTSGGITAANRRKTCSAASMSPLAAPAAGKGWHSPFPDLLPDEPFHLHR